MTLNWAKIWIFCTPAGLWISCITAISYSQDPQAALPKTCSALPRLVPRKVGGPGPGQGDRQASGAAPSAPTHGAFPGHAPGKTFPDSTKIHWPKPTQWLIRSRAGQKNTAAKLWTAGFWISLQKGWHVDQSRTASPIQDSLHTKIFLQEKTQVNPSGSICFQQALVPIKKNKNKAFLMHWCLIYKLYHSPFTTIFFNSGQCNIDECFNIQFSNIFMLVSISLSSLIFNCLKQL